MANLSLDGYLTQRKRNKREDEIERDLAEALNATKREINAYYKKEVDEVGSTQGGSIKAIAPRTTPQSNPGGYAVKPNAHTSIESDLKQALTATKRDLDARVYSTSANVPAQDAGSQSSVKRSTLPGMTPKWEDPAGWENELRKMKEAEENWKTNQTMRKPYSGYSYMNYDRDQDDLIENQYILTKAYNDTFHQKYDTYFTDKAAKADTRRFGYELISDASIPIDLILAYIANRGDPFATFEMFSGGVDQPGFGDFDTLAMKKQKKHNEYILKQNIADTLLENSYYRYLVKGNIDFIEKLKSERQRIRKLPYSEENQLQLEKLDTVIEMNQYYDYYVDQFQKTIDEIYENGVW